MRAILIDASKNAIKEVEIDESIESVYKTMEAEIIEVGFYINGTDCCYIDEEGRINGTKTRFMYDGQIFAGNGLIVGTTKEGDNDSCAISLEKVKELISFPVFKHITWVKRLFNEKGIELDAELVNGQTVSSVLDFCSEISENEQDKVKETLVMIDFKNGDIIHFMNYLAIAVPIY